MLKIHSPKGGLERGLLYAGFCALMLGACDKRRTNSEQNLDPATSETSRSSSNSGINPNAKLEDFVPQAKTTAPHAVHHPDNPNDMPLDEKHVFAGGLTWAAPSAFIRKAPANNMRAAEYAIKDETDTLLTVHFFGSEQGGDANANFSRWVDQFEPDGREVGKFTEKATGMNVDCVEISGTYLGMAMPGQAQPEPKSGYTLMAAVAKGTEGPVFFKLTGPKKTLQKHRQQFIALVRSIRRLG